MSHRGALAGRERRLSESGMDMGFEDEGDVVSETPRGLSIAEHIMLIFVRLLGTALLIFGLIVAVLVVLEAWKLYQEPERIERFAFAVEQGSNLDKILLFDTATTAAEEGTAPSRTRDDNLRLSYFAAWFIVLALMLVLCILAMSAVSTGGQLALYDSNVRRLSRQVIREAKKMKHAA